MTHVSCATWGIEFDGNDGNIRFLFAPRKGQDQAKLGDISKIKFLFQTSSPDRLQLSCLVLSQEYKKCRFRVQPLKFSNAFKK